MKADGFADGRLGFFNFVMVDVGAGQGVVAIGFFGIEVDCLPGGADGVFVFFHAGQADGQEREGVGVFGFLGQVELNLFKGAFVVVLGEQDVGALKDMIWHLNFFFVSFKFGRVTGFGFGCKWFVGLVLVLDLRYLDSPAAGF